MRTGPDGILVIDKPPGITSREALDRAARWFPRTTRAGHAGTLDPLATGVLVLCLGGATRLVEYVQQMGKTYRSTFRLGAASDSDDADGAVIAAPGARDPGLPAVTEALADFVGRIDQVPPAYSAARVGGRRSYDLARRGQEVELRPRAVEVYGIDVLGYAYPELEVEVRCGKGTYIRSLARDLGRRLGCGAYVQALRRTRVGPFRAEDAVKLEAGREEAERKLLPMALALAELPRVVLPNGEAERLRRGQAVALPPGQNGREGEVGVYTEGGAVVAVALAGAGRLRPAKVVG
jgi:tRNA pseudouridine55 synthase